jgi:hypothetical protein
MLRWKRALVTKGLSKVDESAHCERFDGSYSDRRHLNSMCNAHTFDIFQFYSKSSMLEDMYCSVEPTQKTSWPKIGASSSFVRELDFEISPMALALFLRCTPIRQTITTTCTSETAEIYCRESQPTRVVHKLFFKSS